MSTRILIVEDQFVEANALKISLEKADYIVCGIAMSYEQALPYLKMSKPDIVLLDIYLKGQLTGVDLAKVLAKENIPFIYLSANSNQSTLDEAKATRPYGFLVKPFREKDVLMALDIANYRHHHMADLFEKQERLLQQLLNNAIGENILPEQKRLLIAKVFKQFIPFEFIVVDTDLNDEDPNAVFCCQRVGYDDYKLSTGGDYIEKSGLPLSQYTQWRNRQAQVLNPVIENGNDFVRACAVDPILNTIAETCRVRSRMGIPILTNGITSNYVNFFTKETHVFQTDHLDIIAPLRSNLSIVFRQVRKISKNAAISQAAEIPATTTPGQPLDEIIGKSQNLLQALDHIVQVAEYDTPVLILGETGVGKEGLVRALHQLSGRRNQPLITINCAAIPTSLVESELFGHERGAFTGATERKIGKFERAQGGTIFLDEIGEIPLEIQAKLLRVFQEKELERVGGRTTIKINVRIVAATNRNLYKEVAAGNFRMDLYYRINIFPITLPPLRERREDIPLLAAHFLKKYAILNKGEAKSLTPEVLNNLMNYSWPGNIRELEHIIERNIVLHHSNLIDHIELPPDVPTKPLSLNTVATAGNSSTDKERIVEALKACGGKVAGNDGAAEMLGISPTALYAKMKKLGIKWKFEY